MVEALIMRKEATCCSVPLKVHAFKMPDTPAEGGKMLELYYTVLNSRL